MATFKTPALQFEEDVSLENLTGFGPNPVMMMVVDEAGTKLALRLSADEIKENETILCNTTTGMCLKLIDGQWVWVPC